jgi:hypothetical protein
MNTDKWINISGIAITKIKLGNRAFKEKRGCPSIR